MDPIYYFPYYDVLGNLFCRAIEASVTWDPPPPPMDFLPHTPPPPPRLKYHMVKVPHLWDSPPPPHPNRTCCPILHMKFVYICPYGHWAYGLYTEHPGPIITSPPIGGGRGIVMPMSVCLFVVICHCVFVRVFAKFQSVISQPFLNRSLWNGIHITYGYTCEF